MRVFWVALTERLENNIERTTMKDDSTRDTEQHSDLPSNRSGLPVIESAVSFPRDSYQIYEYLAAYSDVVRSLIRSTEMDAKSLGNNSIRQN